VKRDELRRRLERLELPDEHDARVRAWELVQAAFAEREPAPLRRARLRPAIALAVIAAVVAAALSPPGRALIETVRETIGVEEAAPALFELPTRGRLLVTSARGAWIVRQDGSKRLLGRYREASWSPNGLYVVAARANELVALDPDSGELRWSLPRPDVRHPRWSGSRTDTRIAYLSGSTLRVVAGDGTGDRALVRSVARVAPAWRPGSGHVLVYAAGAEIRAVAADTGRRLWTRRIGAVSELAWSLDGSSLLVRGPRRLVVLGLDGRLRLDLLGPGAAPVAAAALSPSGSALAWVQRARGRGTLWVVPKLRTEGSAAARRVFSGAGRFTDVEWSPDGRWLLLAWQDADQWVFLRSAGVRRLEAVSAVSQQFRSRNFPSLGGWCCTPGR
jgi:hypothetical protein